MKALALSALPYSMDNEDGTKNKGVSLWFIDGQPSALEKCVGTDPMKISLADNLYPALVGKLPAIIDVEQGVRRGAGNKATLTITALTVIKPVDIAALLKNS
jgi:hypothetical protein